MVQKYRIPSAKSSRRAGIEEEITNGVPCFGNSG